MRKRFLIFGILTTMTCVFVLGQMIGNYKSAEYNFIERGLLYLRGIQSYVGGNDLTLNSDSSFLMITCSVIETGNWSCSEDSLFLAMKTRKWRNDSIQNVGYYGEWPTIPTRPKTYKIIDNGFYREIYGNRENKKIKSVDKLIRNNLP